MLARDVDLAPNPTETPRDLRARLPRQGGLVRSRAEEFVMLARAVERTRYASADAVAGAGQFMADRSESVVGYWREVAEGVSAGFLEAVSPRDRRRATLWPSSGRRAIVDGWQQLSEQTRSKLRWVAQELALVAVAATFPAVFNTTHETRATFGLRSLWASEWAPLPVAARVCQPLVTSHPPPSMTTNPTTPTGQSWAATPATSRPMPDNDGEDANDELATVVGCTARTTQGGSQLGVVGVELTLHLVEEALLMLRQRHGSSSLLRDAGYGVPDRAIGPVLTPG